MKALEKEALLIMFGKIWQRRFLDLDGQEGRPSITECIDFALRDEQALPKKDLKTFLENYLARISKQCKNGQYGLRIN